MSTRRHNRQIQSRHFTGADTMALPQTLGDHHAPENVREAQTMARQWHRDSLLVGSGIRAQVAFANYGFRLRPVPRMTPDTQAALRAWWQINRSAINRFIRETWEDWFIMDNSVAFWRTRPRSGRCFVLAPEKCTYKDTFGIESLKVRLDWKKGDAPEGVPESLEKRYAGAKDVELDSRQGEEFSVLKRGRVGAGFAWPSMTSLFDDLHGWQSLQMGDKLWAYLTRTVVRHIKVGHEIRNGQHAGSGKWFWTAQRGAAIRKFFEGRLGILDFTSNFDTNVEFPFPSADRWDARRYEGFFSRIALWFGPVGQIISPRPNEFLAKTLRAWAEAERDAVEHHIRSVVMGCFKPPVEILPVWSNRIFTDARTVNEMVRALLQAGPLSQTSALEEAGFDALQERNLKDEEAQLPKSQTLPIFDPAHGKRPAEPSGRPKEAS